MMIPRLTSFCGFISSKAVEASFGQDIDASLFEYTTIFINEWASVFYYLVAKEKWIRPRQIKFARIMGFGICFTCGYLMTFMSFRLFIKLVEGNPAPFVFLYTSGNILSLMSSVFLSGPQRQFKNMFDEKRKLTSIVYLSTLCTSITVCFIPIPTGPKIGLLVILLLVQMCASLWYTLSYIPYGRASAKRMLRSIVAMDE